MSRCVSNFRSLYAPSGHLVFPEDKNKFKVADHNGTPIYETDKDPREWMEEAGIRYDPKVFPVSEMLWLLLDGPPDVRLFEDVLAMRIMGSF